MGRKRNRKKTLAVKKAGPPESARQTADKLRRINVWSATLTADKGRGPGISQEIITDKIRSEITSGKRLYKIMEDVETEYGLPVDEAIRNVLTVYRENQHTHAMNLR